MATVTITTAGGAEDAAIQKAVGKRDNLRDAQGNLRNATVAEIKAHVMNYLRNMTKEVDLEDKRSALVGIDITLT